MLFQDYYNQRKSYLDELVHIKRHALSIAPDGAVRICQKGRNYQFYLRNSGDLKNGKYIPKAQQKLGRSLAQKAYDRRVLELAEQELHFLKSAMKSTPKQTVETAFSAMPESYQAFIKQIIPPPVEVLNNWYSQEYPAKEFVDGSSILYSEFGEKMRSKTEVLISGLLRKHGIPYLYEKPLMLKGYGQIHPDFTLFDLTNQCEVYWEHFGMMDDLNYSNRAISKINAYLSNQYVYGERFFVTFESSSIRLKMNLVEDMIIRFKESCGIKRLGRFSLKKADGSEVTFSG